MLNRGRREYSKIAGFGVAEDRHRWSQCVDSSKQDLLVYISDICDFIDRMASPALSSLTSLPTEHEKKLQEACLGSHSVVD